MTIDWNREKLKKKKKKTLLSCQASPIYQIRGPTRYNSQTRTDPRTADWKHRYNIIPDKQVSWIFVNIQYISLLTYNNLQ